MTKEAEDFLRTLPPDIAARVRAGNEDPRNQQALKILENMLNTACDAALHMAVIAYSEAKNDEERETVIRAAVVSTVTLHTVRIVFEHAVPPQPRTTMIDIFVQSANSELERYDTLLRPAIIEGVKKREEILAAKKAAEVQNV